MLAKPISKNQLTLPKSATAAVGATDYFDVTTENGRIALTPVRVNRADGAETVSVYRTEIVAALNTQDAFVLAMVSDGFPPSRAMCADRLHASRISERRA